MEARHLLQIKKIVSELKKLRALMIKQEREELSKINARKIKAIAKAETILAEVSKK